MRAAVHTLAARDVLFAIGEGGARLAQAVADTAARLDQGADVVIVAVPAGSGRAFADRLVAADRGPAPAKPRPRYTTEPEDADIRDLMEGSTGLPTRTSS